MATKHVNQKELASSIGVTPREIYNLAQKGMPKRVKSGKTDYPLDECVQWYLKFKVEAARQDGDANKEKRAELNRRKLEAEVRTAELELAQLEGSLVTIDYMERQLEASLQALRAKVLNFPGRVAPHVMGIKSIPEAHLRIQPMVAELLDTLAGSGDELDADEEAEPAERTA